MLVVPDYKMLHLVAGTLRPVAVVNGNELSGRQEKEFFLFSKWFRGNALSTEQLAMMLLCIST